MGHPLDALFAPEKIAVFGASEHQDSVGGQVFRNLLSGGFAGHIYPINPKYEEVAGVKCTGGLEQLGVRVDLAVVATPAVTVPAIVRQCGAAGVRAMIVLSAGFSEVGEDGRELERTVVEEARRWDIQLLGPNCLGLICTASKMNATFSDIPAKSGSLALVSQSGALCTAILDWATDLPIGFSSVISVGDAAGIGFGELLDYLATDKNTTAILLYVEGVKDARRFMSGLRAAARLKPTLVLKVGNHESAVRAAQSHSGALVGADDVFDAALRRAGAVRVHSIGQLFATAQVLMKRYHSWGTSLAVVSNAGGPAVMAVDRAAEVGVALAELSESTIAGLSEVLPAHWSRHNPVDVIGDAGPDRYRAALSVCLADENCHGLLVILTPQAMTRPTGCAAAVIEAAANQPKPVVACWMGGARVAEGRELLRKSGIPTFNTPESAVDAIRYLWAYSENRRLLLQVPSPLTFEARHDVTGARLIIEAAIAEGRNQLDTLEAKAVLRAFGIRCTMPIRARSASEALVAAENLGFPVALKIDSPDISHKTEVKGVRLNITTGKDVRRVFSELTGEAQRVLPTARITGVTVERMHSPRDGREVMVGVVNDACFGPSINVGAGGVLVELLKDKAIGLPPLNSTIVRDMLRRTVLEKWLGPWRGHPPANMNALEEVLLRVSDLVCELPEVRELDINPLVVDPDGATCVDARFVVGLAASGGRAYSHVAIHPYPGEQQIREQLPGGEEILIRPIRPEDAESEQQFVSRLSERSKAFRFMGTLNELTPAMLARFTQIDYEREMAFVALCETQGNEQIGVSRYVTNSDGTSCEFALVVADEWHGKGVGSRLMKALFRAARQQNLTTMVGEVDELNRPMLNLTEALGFAAKSVPGTGIVSVTKTL
jgi:acetyltransferase